MKLNRNVYWLLLTNVVLQGFYWLYFREEIIRLYYSEQVEGFWVEVVKTFYPRFFVEKYRFDLDFFLKKAEQILWRLLLISIFLAFLSKFIKKNIFHHFFSVTLERRKVVFLQILLTCGWVYESFTWYKSLLRLAYLKELYEPYLLLRFVPFPETESFFYWFVALYVCFLLSFVPRVAGIFWVFSVALIIILLGFLYGFGKLDHTYATWLYVSILLTFLLQNQKQVDAWALRLMQCVVASVYLQAGLEKLLISGWEWFSPETLRHHLLTHATAWGITIAKSDVLCVLGSVFILFFQLGFVSILFFPKLKYIFLPSGVMFHIATFILMNVGGLLSYWYLVYVIFLLGEKQKSEKI